MFIYVSNYSGNFNIIEFRHKNSKIIVVCNPSGNGKSTIIRCINRLEEIDEGKILFHGKDIREIKPIELKRR